MALETPNQTVAAAVVLVQEADTAPTFQFRSVAGFQSVGLVDAGDPLGGYVLDLTNPVTNDEALCWLGADPNLSLEQAFAFVTPSHLESLSPAINALPANRAVAGGYAIVEAAFRFWIQVTAIHSEATPIPGEPLAP